MKTNRIISSLAILFCTLTAYGALDISSSTTNWTAVSYNNGLYPDYYADQQTGQSDSDIVGTNSAPAFYTQFDNAGTPGLTDGTLAFRVRVSSSSKSYWENVLFIGMDANRDGALDLFAGLYKNNSVNLYYPGTGLNISPNTTTIQAAFYTTAATAANYSFIDVNAVNAPGQSTDIDANGKTDYFVSFSVDFGSIVSALSANNIFIDETSPIMFLAATATQQNSLNQDLNGAPKISSSNGSLTWEALGAASVATSATGIVIPEPQIAGLFIIGCISLHFLRRMRIQKSVEDDTAE